MITCKLLGGLGNQLFQIFATITYGIKANNEYKFLNVKTLDENIYDINDTPKDIDYIIEFDKNNKISKSNKENILLTPDCFKRLCLLSRTKKAEEVRTYFIEIEKLLFNYKDYIIKALEKTVNILENN